MNFKLNSSKENNILHLFDQLVVVIDEHMTVLHYEGASELFFKQHLSKEAYSLKDFLGENIYEKLYKYLTQALLTGSKVISKYYFIQTSKKKLSLRFVVAPDQKNLSTSIFMEALTVEDSTIIYGKALSSTSVSYEHNIEVSPWETVFMHSAVGALLLDSQGKLIKGIMLFVECLVLQKKN